MSNRRMRLLAVLAGSLEVDPMLAGCQEKSAPLTKQEEASFKGGPMPEEARQIMQQKLREAQSKSERPVGGPR